MSSTRGFFIGQLIDDLAAVSHQVENRCRFGFTDLNRMLEDFFRDVLNILLGGQLTNLNAERLNEPGLDLGDETARTAFQITSVATTAKIHKTLEKITPAQASKFDKIRVLIIGAKQGSYSLDQALSSKVHFTEADIWDLSDLSRMAISLPALDLQRLHRLVADEVARVRVELELPAPDGKYPTGLDDYIEKVGKPTRSDASIFYAAEATEGLLGSQADAQTLLDQLAVKLAGLPRISREFYTFLWSRSEERNAYGGGGRHVNADLCSRLSSYPDTDGELRFLMDRNFIDYDEPDHPGKSAYWRILLPVGTSDFDDAFFYFVKEAGTDMKRVFVSLDFSPFGPPPLVI